MAPMIHYRKTQPFPPRGSRVSVRDKLDYRKYYFNGIVEEITKDYVRLGPGCEGFYIKNGVKRRILGDEEYFWIKNKYFQMMVVESLDNCDGSEWDAVDRDKRYGDTTLVKTGGKDFSDYFLSELFSDFKITCEDVTFNCHKIILANGSPVFEAAINSDMLEAKSGCLEIEDCKPNVVKFILEFIYKSEIDIKNLKEDPVFAMEVLAAADKYRMEKLKDLCEKKLCFQIVTENALQLLIVGDMYGAAELKESALKIIVKNKKNIVNQEDFNLFVKRHPQLTVEIMKLSADVQMEPTKHWSWSYII